jgi:pyruvate dehydrogenase E2 component (dihydrolipoamide acetyltransferase)
MALKPVPLVFEDVPLTPVRKAIGDRVLITTREAPVFHLQREVDASALIAARGAAKAAGGEIVPTYNDFLIKAVAGALVNHPSMNALFVDDVIRMAKPVNLAFAVATEKGVLLPVVYEADAKAVAVIAEETREMVDLARRGRLRASLQQDATFTISNIGPVGVDSFNAIISPPQVGILAIGGMAPRPMVADGKVEARPTLRLTLSVDHRAVDGGDAAPFLAAVADGILAIAWPGA